MPALDLLAIGDVNPDVVVSDLELDVQFGQAERLVDSATLTIGGSASITAMGAARLGLATGVCGVVGVDESGAFMVDALTERGVDLTRIRSDSQEPTGLSVVLSRGNDRAILTAPGTISALSDVDLAALPDAPARHVHVSSYFLMSQAFRDSLPDALKRFRAAGVGVSLDSNWDPSGDWSLVDSLSACDLWLPNQAELMAVTGCADVRSACEAARGYGCNVVAKLGERGAVASCGDEIVWVTTTPPTEFGDAIGAGDSFNAGFLAGHLTGADTEAALRLAVAAGTLSTRGVGGTATQPDRQEADALAGPLIAHRDWDGIQ